jgi:hypothetical protein
VGLAALETPADEFSSVDWLDSASLELLLDAGLLLSLELPPAAPSDALAGLLDDETPAGAPPALLPALLPLPLAELPHAAVTMATDAAIAASAVHLPLRIHTPIGTGRDLPDAGVHPAAPLCRCGRLRG